MANQKPNSALRTIAKELGIVGAEPTNAFEFTSRVGSTDLRNEAISTNAQPGQQISLGDDELAKQVAERLRTSGPATFRNLRDIIGTSGIQDVQEQFGLRNVPSSVLNQEQKTKPGNTIAFTGAEGNTLTGVRKSLAQSLKPETQEQTLRRKTIGKNKTEILQEEIDTQLAEQEVAKARGQQEPNFIERIAGIGSTFLDNLFKPNETKPTPVSSMIVPETGEEITFESELDQQLALLQQEADDAISKGADPKVVNRRLAEMVAQLQRGKQ